jgi:mannosyl-oligosaccharide alpha-1,2-mannosidase
MMFITNSYVSPSVILFLLAYVSLPSLTLDPMTCCKNQHGDMPSAKSVSAKSTVERIGKSQTCPLSFAPLPKGMPRPIPRIQHQFGLETQSHRRERTKRQQAVKKAFQHSWNGYKNRAWLWDEVLPISGGQRNPLGSWAATLVDSLDILVIMNLDHEFEEALEALNKIDFSTPRVPSVNVFETTIRYLGGLISAYDLTKGKHSILLKKAHELGDFLYGAFDTPSRMPQTRWPWIR